MQDPAAPDPSRLVADPGDRRTFRRIDLNMLAHVRVAGPPPLAALSDSAASVPALYEYQTVLVSDMSMTGLFFSSALAYAVGSEMEVSLRLSQAHFVVAGTIARRVRLDNRHFGYGINFQQNRTSKEFRIALATFLLRRDAAVPPSPAVAASRPR